jgi:hypothetical protein
MSTPESKLAAALSAFLGEVKDPSLDGVNPHFRSKYATLPGVLQCVRPLLAKHKLAVTQAPDIREGKLVMFTRLMHADGEVIESAMPLPESTNMQAMGSAMTYARRYALTALLGVAGDEDDDGNATSSAKPAKASTAPKVQPTPTLSPANDDGVPFPDGIDPAADDVVLVADWTETVIPAGKHKGKLLSELQPPSAEWFCKNYKAKRPDEMQFRAALNACARALNFNKPPPP